MRHDLQPPVYNEAAGELRNKFANVEVIWTEDPAGCITVEVRPDPVAHPPVRIVIGGSELFSDHPDEEVWQQLADAKRPELERAAQKRRMRQDLSAKLRPGATQEEIIDAAVETAEQHVKATVSSTIEGGQHAEAPVDR